MSAQALTVFTSIAGALGVVAGAVLMLVPGRLLHERTGLRRWLFEIDLVSLLDQRRSIERRFYRHHYAFGAAVTAGAIAWFVALWGLRENSLVMDALVRILGVRGASALILTDWALAIFALGIGVFLLVRPSALKGFEAVANRWIEPFRSARERSAAAGGSFIAHLVLRAPRPSALLLLTAGSACLFA